MVQFLNIAFEKKGVKYNLFSKSVIHFTFQIIEEQMTIELKSETSEQIFYIERNLLKYVIILT